MTQKARQPQRPRQGRRYRRKSHRLRNFTIFILLILIIGGGIWVLSGNFKKADNMLQKSFYPIKYSEYVDKAARDYNLDRELIYAVIRTESKFNPKCKSKAGAIGLMQVMPDSFKWIQKLRKTTLDEDELWNPSVNIDYGCYLLNFFKNHYKDEKCAVAAYNAGFVVTDWLKNPKYSYDGKTLQTIPYPETEKYVNKVEKAKSMYKKLYFS